MRLNRASLYTLALLSTLALGLAGRMLIGSIGKSAIAGYGTK